MNKVESETLGMKFFTYDYGDYNKFLWPYLIVKLKNYFKHPKKERYDKILIDPGVYDLQQNPYYSWEGTINIPEFLDNLPHNHYFSWESFNSYNRIRFNYCWPSYSSVYSS